MGGIGVADHLPARHGRYGWEEGGEMGPAGGMRKRGWVFALCCAGLFLLASLFVSCQCGRSVKGEQEEVEQKEEEIDGDESEEEGARTGDGEDEEEDEEGGEDEIPESGGISEFDLNEKSIGSGSTVSDLEVADIRWADHGDYFRIVFEFARSGGGEVTAVPNCHTWYSGAPGDKEYHKIYITLEDIPTYRFDYAPFAADDTPVSLGDPLVETLQRVGTADTEPVFFLVTCSYSPAHPGVSSRPHRLIYQTHPMRIILDILKY